jgi:hypothetical protein
MGSEAPDISRRSRCNSPAARFSLGEASRAIRIEYADFPFSASFRCAAGRAPAARAASKKYLVGTTPRSYTETESGGGVTS